MGAVAGRLVEFRRTVKFFALAAFPVGTCGRLSVPINGNVVVLTARRIAGHSGPGDPLGRDPQRGWSLALQSVADYLQFGVSGVVEG